MAHNLSRREWVQAATAGVLGASASGWLENLAHAQAQQPQRHNACILLWMNGGPSQIDTFDPKPLHANGAGVQAIDTSVPGIHIAENLPRLARQAHHLGIIRSMTSRDGEHGRATYHLRTGYLPLGAIQYPSIGSLIAKELARDEVALPNFVSIAPFRAFNPAAYSSGFLGPQYAPMTVGEQINFGLANDAQRALQVQDLDHSAGNHFDSRFDMLQEMQREFAARHPSLAARSHASAYERAVRLMRTSARAAFNVEEEPRHLREAYGMNLFGQGCLLARRLVEQGVPFVEVNLASSPLVPQGWDTHQDNNNACARLCSILDPAFATLISDLDQRGMLESTLVVWMGEFGRTPRMNNLGAGAGQSAGRDHWTTSWSTVLAGGRIRGGQVHGATTADGTAVVGEAVTVPDFLATVCAALGIDSARQNMSNVGRPIRITDNGRPVNTLLA